MPKSLFKTLLEMGHDVCVFAPTLDSASRDWHYILLRGEEKIVERCYDEVDELRQRAKACRHKLVDWDSDMVLVEVYRRLPLSLMEELRDVAGRRLRECLCCTQPRMRKQDFT